MSVRDVTRGWGQSTGPFYRDSIEFPFFMCHLRDQCGPELAKAIVFEMGANRWHRYDAWPPKAAVSRTIYLNTGNRLTWEPPTEASSFDSYVSDPKKAVPYTMATSFGYYRQYPIDDQRLSRWCLTNRRRSSSRCRTSSIRSGRVTG